MTLPKWIEPKISLGNILTIIAMMGAVMAAAQSYGAVVERVDQHDVAITSIRMEANTLKEQVIDDRLSTRETLAEMKTDVGYIRRYVEEERRADRP